MLLQAPQSAYRMGCLAAAPPTRREGRLRREGLTRHAASRTPHVESPRREAPSGIARPSGGSERGHGMSARARRVRATQEVETVTGRVRREATARADATSMCAAKSKAHQESSRRDKERKKCSKGLDNCGHIEGLYSARPCSRGHHPGSGPCQGGRTPWASCGSGPPASGAPG